jgi:hypothetical protein
MVVVAIHVLWEMERGWWRRVGLDGGNGGEKSMPLKWDET